MSGIPIYNQAPITAAKASDPTPQTASPPSQPTPLAPATTTTAPTTSTFTYGYPAARPGASVVPAPTGAAASRYVPLTPTPTTKQDDSPPPPQPGAVPTPATTMRSNIPPPPKAGEAFNPEDYKPAPSQARPQPYPPQMSYAPPSYAYGAQPPSSSTSTTTQPSNSYPVPLPVVSEPRRSLEHPPGYAQNPYASDLSPDQRRAQASQQEPGIGGYGGGFSGGASAGNSSERKEGTGAAFGVDPDAVWDSAKKWIAGAGQKLQEGEAEVWKRINGQK